MEAPVVAEAERDPGVLRRGDRRFRIRGNLAGADYTSFTFQSADKTGAAGGITAARNHTQFDAAPDGSYELVIGPGASGRNGVPLDAKTVSVTTRHYFENALSVQLDPSAPSSPALGAKCP